MIISELCQNLDSLDEPDAKASMIWIVGEYAERLGVCPLSGIVRDEVPAASLVCSFPVRIDNSGDLLETFLETFHEDRWHPRGVSLLDSFRFDTGALHGTAANPHCDGEEVREEPSGGSAMTRRSQ